MYNRLAFKNSLKKHKQPSSSSVTFITDHKSFRRMVWRGTSRLMFCSAGSENKECACI